MTSVFMNKVAECVRYHRKKSGLSQANLAKFAGVGKTVVYDIEQGKESIQINTLLKIFNVLNITLHLESKLMKAFTESLEENHDAES
jgi:HTH-type transcriptional regulator/antitoxin HipB